VQSVHFTGFRAVGLAEFAQSCSSTRPVTYIIT
jgi:hypothetical protein